MRMPESLAHAAFLSRGGLATKRVTAFPDIQLNWNAFCLPTVHIIGVRRDHINVHSLEFSLVYWHEMSHWNLAPAPVSQIVRILNVKMWNEIRRLANMPSPEKVDVPLRVNEPTNDLERLWSGVVRFSQRGRFAQEIFAVWGSLFFTKSSGNFAVEAITDAEERIIDSYESIYKGFRDTFARFRNVADGVDYEMARAIAYGPIHSHQSKEALLETLAQAQVFIERHETDPIKVLEYYTQSHPDEIDLLVQELSDLGLRNNDLDLHDPYSGVPGAVPIICIFDESEIYPPSRASLQEAKEWVISASQGNWRDEHGKERTEQMFNHADDLPVLFWYESLRQQLTQGVGLRCLFWDGQSCCGRQSWLERLYLNIKPSSASENNWRRQGCIASRTDSHPQGDVR